MPEITQPRLHHLALTSPTSTPASAGTARSSTFIRCWTYRIRAASGRSSPMPTGQLMIALHRHEANDRQRFSETTTGLDHAGFLVTSPA